jgi:hypothetical protein
MVEEIDTPSEISSEGLSPLRMSDGSITPDDEPGLEVFEKGVF